MAFEADGIVWDTKRCISQEQNVTFPWNKKIVKLHRKDYIFRSYHFLAEVTLKNFSEIFHNNGTR